MSLKVFALLMLSVFLSTTFCHADTGTFLCLLSNGAQARKDRRYGFMDSTGKIAIPCKFASVGKFSDGLAMAKDNNSKLYGYINTTGKFVIKPIYYEVGPFKDGFAVVVRKNNGKRVCSIIDKTGKLLFPFDKFKFTDMKKNPTFIDGIAYGETKTEAFWLNKSGKVVLKLPRKGSGYSINSRFTSGLIRFSIPNPKRKTNRMAPSSLYGWYDKNGKIAITSQYGEALDFEDGLARVRKRVGNSSQYGFINPAGKMVIPLGKYPHFGGFFSEGLGATVSRETKKYGFVDKTGKMVIPAKYDRVTDFHDGLSCVKIGRLYGLIDKTGNLITPIKYRSINITPWINEDDCDMSLIPVELENRKKGFINRKGKIVINPKFKNVAYFAKNGLCKVELDDKNGSACFIDKTGRIIIPAKKGMTFYYYGQFTRAD